MPWNDLRISSAARGCFEEHAYLSLHCSRGATVDEFLAWFPGVQRRQVEAVLDFGRRIVRDAWDQVLRE